MRDKDLLLIPGYDPYRDAGDCVYDKVVADRAIEFFTKHLTHVKGKWAGTPFKLEPWQTCFLRNLFGWIRPDKTRRYREAFLFVPRKNGKSAMAAGIANYMLFCDGEPGAEIYCAAAEREQAALVFDVAKQQVLQDPVLNSYAKVYRSAIVIESNASRFKAISADAGSKHGFNSHCVIIDELHAQKNRELVDVLMTSTGARTQPLVIHITTSDFERPSICNEKHDYASKVRDGVFQDLAFLPAIWEATKDDDWTDRETWRKANPNYGISISEEYIQHECERAQNEPSFENTFKRLHLNIRTEQDSRWFGIDRWDSCCEDFDPNTLCADRAFAGLDLSTTTDLSAFVLAIPKDGIVYTVPYFWMPESRVRQKEKDDRVPYSTWVREGLIEATPGDVVDYAIIRRKVNEIGKKFRIYEIGADPWNALQLLTELAGDGFDVVEFRQGFASMSAPSKELEKYVVGRILRHDGNAVLRWMASNVAVTQDAAGNIKPARDKSGQKIDGIVALIMAIGRIMVAEQERASAYKGRGFLTV